MKSDAIDRARHREHIKRLILVRLCPYCTEQGHRLTYTLPREFSDDHDATAGLGPATTRHWKRPR